jgi:cytochrome c oxidase assembly factor CtaG
MTIAGHGSRRIFVHHGKGIATFLAASVPGCWIILGLVAGGIAAAACVAMLLLLTLRVLAYRLHTKRSADFLVSILAGLLMLVACSIPVALPVLALAMLWQLQRRGQAKTWLLA